MGVCLSLQLPKVWHSFNVFTYLSFHSSDDGASVQEMLSEITNQRTVPNIFVNKVHLGGCDGTFQVIVVFCVFNAIQSLFSHVLRRGERMAFRSLFICLLEVVKWESL